MSKTWLVITRSMDREDVDLEVDVMFVGYGASVPGSWDSTGRYFDTPEEAEEYAAELLQAAEERGLKVR